MGDGGNAGTGRKMGGRKKEGSGGFHAVDVRDAAVERGESYSMLSGFDGGWNDFDGVLREVGAKMGGE
jgi:hypothetical protein